jgi:hypothetical protein
MQCTDVLGDTVVCTTFLSNEQLFDYLFRWLQNLGCLLLYNTLKQQSAKIVHLHLMIIVLL